MRSRRSASKPYPWTLCRVLSICLCRFFPQAVHGQLAPHLHAHVSSRMTQAETFEAINALMRGGSPYKHVKGSSPRKREPKPRTDEKAGENSYKPTRKQLEEQKRYDCEPPSPRLPRAVSIFAPLAGWKCMTLGAESTTPSSIRGCLTSRTVPTAPLLLLMFRSWTRPSRLPRGVPQWVPGAERNSCRP